MNKRKGFLEELKNNNTQKTKLKFYIQILQFYFAIYDLDNGTNHLQIIGLLYTVSTDFTYEKIAKHIGISDATLTRYIRKYKYSCNKGASRHRIKLHPNQQRNRR